MMQNLASKPKANWRKATDDVITSGFLYFIKNAFI